MTIDYMDTPIGTLEIEASETGISRLIFSDTSSSKGTKHPLIRQCQKQLQEYFDNKRSTFDLPLDIQGTTFQQDIWNALVKIPYGTTVSYSHLANSVNRPKAIRAAGTANGQNPISIIIPCHRVIGLNGALTGYAWGLERKSWLLNHEGVSV